MNMIYLHKACTKLLQLTVIGWTITLLSQMAGSVFFFFEAIFLVSLFLFLTCICIVMLIKLEQAFFFSRHSGDGLFNVPTHVPAGVWVWV